MQKHSKQRDAVAQALCRLDCHPTASQVFDEVRLSFPHISLATVYRHLSDLVVQGLAVSIPTEEDAMLYDGTVCPHGHLVCRDCGRVLDMALPFSVEELSTEAEIDRVNVVFYGRCAVCKNNH